MPERFGGSEQLVEVEHAQEPSAPECGIIDRIGAGQRTGVSERRFGAERLPAGFDHEHGLCARRSARGGHELARLLDRFDVEKNGASAAVEGKVVEEIGEIDVETVADRDHRRKSDRARRCPFHQSRRDRSRLRDEGKVAGRRHRGGKAGVELDTGYQHSEAVGADEAHPRRPRDRPALIRQRARTVAEPSAENDADWGAFSRCRGHYGWNDGGRHSDDRDVGSRRQLVVAPGCGHFFDRVVARINQIDRTGKTAAAKVSQHGTTGG